MLRPLPLQGAWVRSLVREPRSCKLRGTAKKKKKESVTYLVLFDKSAFGVEWDDRRPCNTQHFTMCQTYKGDSDVKLHNAQDGNIYDSKCRFTSKFTQLIGIISDQVGSTTKSLNLQMLPCSGLPR